ncbi:hypothetical protein BDZ45DRAFT_262540 [Acephala macrosclerotiorum]|nr:hypothetical protein BDZ45DRAFT_262540 [Acephala macrosclerotiorum]
MRLSKFNSQQPPEPPHASDEESARRETQASTPLTSHIVASWVSTNWLCSPPFSLQSSFSVSLSSKISNKYCALIILVASSLRPSTDCIWNKARRISVSSSPNSTPQPQATTFSCRNRTEPTEKVCTASPTLGKLFILFLQYPYVAESSFLQPKVRFV